MNTPTVHPTPDHPLMRESNDLVHDPVKAEEMAYAEKPYREEAIQLKKVAAKIIDMHANGQTRHDLQREIQDAEFEAAGVDSRAHTLGLGQVDPRTRIGRRKAAKQSAELRAEKETAQGKKVFLEKVKNVLAHDDTKTGFQNAMDRIESAKMAADMKGDEAAQHYDETRAMEEKLAKTKIA